MRWGRIALGLFAGLGLMAGAGVTALAASGMVSITVNQLPVKFFYNGQDETPPNGIFDNQGSKVPDAFIYDGTTYVPVRLVSNLLGVPVQWVGAQHAVAIGKPITGSYLVDLKPYRGQVNTPSTGTMAGTTYENVVQFSDGGGYGTPDSLPNVYYNLNAGYSKFTFTAGLDDSGADGATVTILGDGQQLWAHTFTSGDMPVQASVPVAGVDQLEFQVQDNGGWGTAVDFANATLTP